MLTAPQPGLPSAQPTDRRRLDHRQNRPTPPPRAARSHLVRLAQANDRTITAEVHRAIRLYLSDHEAPVPTSSLSFTTTIGLTITGPDACRQLPHVDHFPAKHAHAQRLSRGSCRVTPLGTLASDSSRPQRTPQVGRAQGGK